MNYKPLYLLFLVFSCLLFPFFLDYIHLTENASIVDSYSDVLHLDRNGLDENFSERHENLSNSVPSQNGTAESLGLLVKMKRVIF
jgi:hypothetical protein